MFCSNCGNKVTGNFCAYCGTAVADTLNADNAKSTDNIVELNGVQVNMTEIINTYSSSVEAIKKIGDLTGANSKEISNAYFLAKNQLGMIELTSEQKAKMELKAKMAQMDKEGIAYCPKCGSTSLTAHKKGFGIGKAVIGAAVIGPFGLVAGNIGAKKVRVTCLKCGYQFFAGHK